MTNINFDANFWAQADGTYSNYVMSTDIYGNKMCTLTNDVDDISGSIPSGNILYTGSYSVTDKGGNFYNYGIISIGKNGRITLDRISSGTFFNYGAMNIYPSGTLDNKYGYLFSNQGFVMNAGTLRNDGNWSSDGIFVDDGTLTGGNATAPTFYGTQHKKFNGTLTITGGKTIPTGGVIIMKPNENLRIFNGTVTNNGTIILDNATARVSPSNDEIYSGSTIGYLANTNGTVLSNNHSVSGNAPSGGNYIRPVSNVINITSDYTLPPGALFDVPNGKTLKIPNGVTFTI